MPAWPQHFCLCTDWQQTSEDRQKRSPGCCSRTYSVVFLQGVIQYLYMCPVVRASKDMECGASPWVFPFLSSNLFFLLLFMVGESRYASEPPVNARVWYSFPHSSVYSQDPASKSMGKSAFTAISKKACAKITLICPAAHLILPVRITWYMFLFCINGTSEKE